MPSKACRLTFSLSCGRRALTLASVSTFWTKVCLILVSLATVFSGEVFFAPCGFVPMLILRSGLLQTSPRSMKSASAACAVGGNSEAGGSGANGRGGKRKQSDVPCWQLEEEMDTLVGSRMPFKITRVSPPPATHLGYALLHPGTSRGDTISLEGCDDSFVVSTVRFSYDLVGGRYRIRSKVVEVQTPRRYNINKQLESLVPEQKQEETS